MQRLDQDDVSFMNLTYSIPTRSNYSLVRQGCARCSLALDQELDRLRDWLKA